MPLVTLKVLDEATVNNPEKIRVHPERIQSVGNIKLLDSDKSTVLFSATVDFTDGTTSTILFSSEGKGKNDFDLSRELKDLGFVDFRYSPSKSIPSIFASKTKIEVETEAPPSSEASKIPSFALLFPKASVALLAAPPAPVALLADPSASEDKTSKPSSPKVEPSEGIVFINPSTAKNCASAGKETFNQGERSVIVFKNGRQILVFGSDTENKYRLDPSKQAPPAPKKQPENEAEKSREEQQTETAPRHSGEKPKVSSSTMIVMPKAADESTAPPKRKKTKKDKKTPTQPQTEGTGPVRDREKTPKERRAELLKLLDKLRNNC